MSIRARSRRRLLLLFVIVVVLVGGFALWYLQRERGRDEDARQARTRGLAAYDAGEYLEAVNGLGKFLKRDTLDPDPLALLRYAQALLELEDLDAARVGSALNQLRRCVAKDPENEEARRLLLDLFQAVGQRTEAVNQANWLLERHPDDADVRSAKVRVLMQMGRYEEAREELEPRLPPSSPRLGDHILDLNLRSLLGGKPADIQARADAVAAEHLPQEPTFGLVPAHARLLVGQRDEAALLLAPLVPLAEDDPVFARLLLPDLQGARLTNDALTMLRMLDNPDLEPQFRVLFAQRLWETGAAAELIERAEAWTKDDERRTTDVLGYLALAYDRQGQTDDAQRMLAVLEERPEQADALGWARLLRGTVLATSPGIRDRIDAAQSAIAADGDNAQSHYALGLAYAEALELGLTLKSLAKASELAGTWGAPAVAATSVLVRLGRLRDALQVAQVAKERFSSEPGIDALLALAGAARDETSGDDVGERILTRLREADLSAEETAPLRIAMLASSGRQDEARAALQELLASDGTLRGPVLLRCAELSRVHGLGLEPACLQRYEALHGSTPQLALAWARHVAAGDGAEAGVQRFAERRAAAGDKDAAAWQLAEALFLESQRFPSEAKSAWETLGEDLPAEPVLLHEVLRSRMAWESSDLIAATTAKLRRITGDPGVWWRVNEARRLLRYPEDVSDDARAAIELLQGALASVPELTEARIWQAEAHAKLGESDAARELLALARADPAAPDALNLVLARMELAGGDPAAATESLDRFVRSRRGSREDALEVATLYARAGAPEQALALLDRLVATSPTVSERVQIARRYAELGAFPKAKALLPERAADLEDRDEILLAATLARLAGEDERASAVLARLDQAVPDPLLRGRLLAGFYREVGDLASAESAWEAVVGIDGVTASDVRELLAVRVLQGKADLVSKTLEQAAAAGVPPASDGRPVADGELMGQAAAVPSLRRLAAATLITSDDALRSAGEGVLRLVRRGKAADLDSSKLKALAAEAPRATVLQLVVGEYLARSGDVEGAEAVLRAAARGAPSNPEPSRALALLYRSRADRARAEARPEDAAELLRRASAAAGQWRARTIGAPLGPDLFLAAIATPQQAVRILEPHVAAAQGDGNLAVIAPYAVALAEAGELAKARNLLAPLLAGDARAVRPWLRVADHAGTSGDLEAAAEMLRHPAVSAAASSDVGLHVDVAAAWAGLPEAGADEARALLRDASGLDALGAGAWQQIGLVYELLGDNSEAEAAYRKAAALGAGSEIAQNNLAMILVRTSRAAEAVALAETLVEAVPSAPEFRDTLAEVYRAAGKPEAALAELERCVELQPGSPRRARKVVEALLEMGKPADAVERLDAFERRFPSSRLGAEERAAWADLRGRVQAAPVRVAPGG